MADEFSLQRLLQADLDPDDPSHRDVEFIRDYAGPILDSVGRYYFRTEFEDVQNVPRDGPFVAIGNHSGGPMLPDVFAMISHWWKIFGVEKPAYAMVHDVVFKIPVIRNLLIRMGALRASRANASKVLDLGGVVVAYPGGTVEALRSFRNRNRIDFGGHTGFIEVALEHGVPILPVVNIGGHEVYFTLFSSRLLARLTGIERLTGVKTLPVNLGLPWGIWPTGFLPYLPLPSKIVFRVGKPIYLPRDPKLARNRRFVSKVLGEVTSSMQYMLDDLASHRRFPILG